MKDINDMTLTQFGDKPTCGDIQEYTNKNIRKIGIYFICLFCVRYGIN